ncbi:hypothetical protein FO519_004576 [Halicephalobus sp. NKZ332]|nr:hypothetical protein FO519_004576 [Halicephalobus sp. NKZ332]
MFGKIRLSKIQNAYEEYESLFSSSSEECNFSINPFDPSISDYIKSPHEPAKCVPKQKNLTFINGKKLILAEKGKYNCEYRYFYHNSGVDDFSVKYDVWKPLDSDQVELEHDFVDVSCRGLLGMEVYRYQHATVIPKKTSIESQRIFKEESEDNPTIIMLGFDGLSKSNYIRQLPRSKEQMEKMGFILMERHVKIADNTFPNWMGVFMGQHTYDYEFKGTVNDGPGMVYDNWTELAWRKFGAHDYVTFFAEDSPKIATFNYDGRTKGFVKRPPTDHYLRPLYLSWEDHLLRTRSDIFCYDSVPVHKIQLNFLQNFLDSYSKKAKFAFSWFLEISHDYLNTVGVADEDFSEFLKKNEKKFENSFLIVFSDHGNRYDKIRETVIGRLESRLPLLSIRAPPWFQKKFPDYFKSLRDNSKVMTSHFDLHATLIHILKKDIIEIETDLNGKLILPSKSSENQGSKANFRHLRHGANFENHDPGANLESLGLDTNFEESDPEGSLEDSETEHIPTEVDLRIRPSAGPESAYGHPARRYKKVEEDEKTPIPESENLKKLNLEVSAVNGVPSFSVSDFEVDPESDPDPDPFALKRRFVPDAYGASPIRKPDQEVAPRPEVAPGSEFAPRPDLSNRTRSGSRQLAAPTASDGFESGELLESAFPLPNCYRTGAGFLCCNRQLEELIYKSNSFVKEKNLSKCNVHAFAQNLDKTAQELFGTTFEIIIGVGDFASKIRFKDNLICKTIADNKVILIWATPEPYSLTEPNTPLVFH